MFDKNKFAQILKNITETYDSQRDFSKKSGINRTYLSQYMNMKLDDPPKPKTLERLANASNGITNYNELMEICGYIEDNNPINIRNSLLLLHKQQSLLDENFKNIGGNLSTEELNIARDLIPQLIQYLFNKSITPKNFNPDEILDDLDFIPEKSKHEIRRFLIDTYNYYYESDKIEKQISKLNSKDYRHRVNLVAPVEYTTEHTTPNNLHMCPVYGQISAGQPNWAEECLEGYLPIDPDLMGIINPEQCFFLRVKGESMNQLIKNGAYALIRKQDIVKNGEVAVVLVNGYEATLKRFTKRGDVIVLEPMSDNPNFKMQIYDKNTRIQILGKYIGKFEMT